MVNNLKNRVGEKHMTNEGYEIEIIEYLNYKDCAIRFISNDIVLKNKSYYNIVNGIIKNPFNKKLYNIGYIGIGEHKSTIEGHKTKKYTTWNTMLQRCYDEKVHKKYPSYKGVTVCEEWHNFQNFAKWFEDNYVENWTLDKDILVKGNKIYSPETCCFVPSKLNNLFTKSNSSRGDLPIGVFLDNGKFRAVVNIDGVRKYFGSHTTPEEAFKAYKKAKENEIKRIVNIYKDNLQIDVYNTVINYKVQITD